MNRRGDDEYDDGLDGLLGGTDTEPTVRIERERSPGPAPRDGGGTRESAVPAEGRAAARSSYPNGREEGPTHSPRPLLVIGLAGLAVLLVLGAFGVGRLFADDGAEAGRAAGAGGGGDRGREAAQGEAKPYEGAVDTVQVSGSSATCQAGDSVDAAGNPTSYQPALAHDSDLATAWRCDGRGRGERLTITLPEETVVAEVGLVPGYAKTDPADGVDRYAENNRITRVRWHFDDGTRVVQRMSGGSEDRSMRTIRLPEVTTTTVQLEILSSEAGPRDTVAVSEVRIAGPSDG
jgi:hypothetical protein